MPYDQVMHKFKHGELHSGSKDGPPVENRDQAIAIMLSEKRKADAGDAEYQPQQGTHRLDALKRARHAPSR